MKILSKSNDKALVKLSKEEWLILAQKQGMTKEESFEDTIIVMGNYVDVLCIRHSLKDAPFIAEENTKCKIINCGNGKDEHPTQALVDLYTILNNFNRINNLNISIIGDLKNSRAAHSLVRILSYFDNNINLISPIQLKMSGEYLKNINFCEKEEFEITNEDIVYMAGFVPNNEISLDKRKRYNLELLKISKSEAIIMNPLPRIDEISKDVDCLATAKYFEQSSNGVFVRMAILLFLFERA
jgi:aspartate carbamoyltransferase catalytic subunit